MRHVLGVDVGGTSMKAALVAEDGRATDVARVETPVGDGVAAVVERLRAFVRESAGSVGGELAAAGLVVPGDVDADAGIAKYSANIGWRDLPLRELIAGDLRVPVVLDHDVRAAAVAERTLGAARGADDCLIVVIGTGIASVSVAQGHALVGATGRAGELGHIPVWPDGEVCACGQRGCLETYASAAALARRYAVAGGTAARTAQEVIERIGVDAIAAEVWQDAITALGVAFATVVLLDDPGRIVIGGGLSTAGEVLLAPVRTAVAGRLTWREPAPIVASPLGEQAGRLGAAVLAWRAAGRIDFDDWPLP
jgi:glucokinase